MLRIGDHFDADCTVVYRDSSGYIPRDEPGYAWEVVLTRWGARPAAEGPDREELPWPNACYVLVGYLGGTYDQDDDVERCARLLTTSYDHALTDGVAAIHRAQELADAYRAERQRRVDAWRAAQAAKEE